MNDMTPVAGHNNPPDPIDVIISQYDDTLSEAQNWLDGEPIENEGQMDAVDKLLRTMRTATTDLGKAKKSSVAPLYDAYKAEGARWKPTEEDFDRIKKGLAALVAPFKAKLIAEKEEAKRKAAAEAVLHARAAREAAQKADATDIEAQREAAAKIEEFEAAQKAAQKAQKDTVKGMRTVQKFEITSMSDVLRWMNKNARAELEACASEYVRKNHAKTPMTGVRSWTEKEAY